MSNVKFSVSWNLEKHICNALSSLQQNGQFVDMTLAADGCFVKVHQLIVALSSPYLRDLISSAQCPHPVIFLNQISYSTLCSLLEYMYSGETQVSPDELNQLIEAGKSLHIKGIQDMTVEHTTLKSDADPEFETEVLETEELQGEDDELSLLQVTEMCDENATKNVNKKEIYMQQSEEAETQEEQYILSTETELHQSKSLDQTEQTMEPTIEEQLAELDGDTYLMEPEKSYTGQEGVMEISNVMQYTVSTQGSLQMILNRFIYFLKYTTQENVRQWRCVDYVTKKKCPAYVIANGNNILKRVAAHQHTYHDSRIIKKLKAQVVFEKLSSAESKAMDKQIQKKKADDAWKRIQEENIEEEMEQ